MLHPHFRAARQRVQRSALVSGALAIATWLTMIGFAKHGINLVCLSPVCAVAIFWCVVSAASVPGEPPGLALIVAMPKEERGDLRKSAPILLNGRILSRRLADLDALARRGERPLSQYVELRLKRGIARHDASELLALVDALRLRVDDEDLASALADLATALRGVQGRTCCLWPGEWWSFAAGNNLGLVKVTGNAPPADRPVAEPSA